MCIGIWIFVKPLPAAFRTKSKTPVLMLAENISSPLIDAHSADRIAHPGMVFSFPVLQRAVFQP
jgi:hypothetical protein